MGLKPRAGQAVIVLAFVNAAIMLLRFGEQCMLARSLGAGQPFDAYFLGQIILLLGGQLTVAVSSAAVPLLIEAGEEAAAVTRSFVKTSAIVLAGLSLMVALVSTPLIQALGVKLDSPHRELARSILLWLTPATAAWILSSVLRAYWNAHRRFVTPGVAQLFIPLATCTGAALLALGMFNLRHVAAVANIGAAVLLIALWKPISSVPRRVADPSRTALLTRKFATTLLPAGVGLALMPGMVVLARSFAARLVPGSVTAVSLAASLGSIPAQFAAVSVGVVLLSETALRKAAGKSGETARVIERALCNTAFVVLPSAVVLMLWSNEIVEIVFRRGAFDKAAVGLTASALSGFSFAVPFQSAVQVIMFALLALGASRSVALTSLLTLGIDAVLSRLLLGWGVAGLAASFSIASFVSCGIFVLLLLKASPELNLGSLLARNLRVAATAVAAGASAYLVTPHLHLTLPLPRLVAGLTLFGLVYFGANLVLGGAELREILGTARSRVERLRPAEDLSDGQIEVLTAAE